MEKIVYNKKLDFKISEEICNKNFEILKIIKDSKRSKVLLIQIHNKKYIYKIPKEGNEKKWKRFISIFRKSDSCREYNNYLKMEQLGFNVPKPIMYFEEKKFGICFASYVVTEYIEGKTGTIDEISLVVDELNKLHKAGFLHGDSQLSNFIINNKKVYFIDLKLKKNIFGSITSVYEYIYLEESCYQNIDFPQKNSKSYRIAKIINRYLHWIGRCRKKIKRKG